MGERRSNRGPAPRSDRQVLANADDVYLLGEIAHGRVRVEPGNRWALRHLSREGLCLAGFGFETTPALLPRGQRIVAAARGEITVPDE